MNPTACHLSTCLTFGLALSAGAQAPLNLKRVEQALPSASVPQDLTVGKFIPNHRGDCAVVVQGGSLFYGFQPGVMKHFVNAGGSGVAQVATVAAIDEANGTLPLAWGGTDRLAVVRGDGLRLLRHAPSGNTAFVDADVTNVSDSSWVGATGLEAKIRGDGASRARYVLGWNANWVKLAHVDPVLGLVPMGTLPTLPGVVVHDAALIDWDAIGAPEVAVLLSTGVAVLAANGQPVAWTAHSQPCAAGRLVAWRLGSTPAVSFVGANAVPGPWWVKTWVPGPTASGVVHSGGTFTLPAPLTGLAVAPINGDQWPDLMISHQGTGHPFVTGTASGPTVGGGLRVIIEATPALIQVPTPANAAPTVIADVNRDGRLDLVAASAASSHLVVQLGLQTQTMIALSSGNNTSSDSGVDPATMLDLESGLMLADTVVGMQPELEDMDFLGLRLKLPTVLLEEYTHAYALVYDMSASGKVLVQSPKVYRYSIGSVSGSLKKLSMLVPVTHIVPPWSGSAHKRFAIEIVLGNAAGTNSSPSFWLGNLNHSPEQSYYPGSGSVQLPPWVMLGWYFKQATSFAFSNLPSAAPTGAEVGPQGGWSSGNRYIGIIGIVVSAEAEAEYADLGAPTPVSGGAVMHN